jgi:uncharacterized RDD family membrane protein YckC
VLADTCDGRLVILLNLNPLGTLDSDDQVHKRFVLYRSEKGSLVEWHLMGAYWGHARALAVLGDEMWVFFDRDVVRRYPIGDDARIESAGWSPAVDTVGVGWPIHASCSDRDGLWVVGMSDGPGQKPHITVARYERKGDLGWQTNFPLGPAVPVVRGGEPGNPDEGLEGQPALAAIVRAHTAQDGVYVYWSLPQPGSGVASKVHGGRLVRSARDGVYWKQLPTLMLDHEDICAAPGEGGRPGLMLREPGRALTGKNARNLCRLELDASERAWLPAQAVASTSEKLMFGFRAGCAWVRWDDGELLVRSDTQRIELMRHRRGAWETVVPPGRSWVMLHLADIQMIVLFVGSALLVVAGSAAFAVRFVRLRRTGMARPRVQPRAGAMPAPIGPRALAAALDLLAVATPVFVLIGAQEPVLDPLVPGWRPLVPSLVLMGAMVLYGTLFEAWFGCTFGKLAVGVRVIDPDGDPPGFVRALLRNVVKPIDFFPLPTGAVGLSFMVLTDSRKRLGDLLAGTAVVVVAPPRDQQPA